MNRLDDLIIGAAIAGMLAVGATVSIRYYGHEKYDDGYAAALAAGQARYEREVAAAIKTETDLRAQLAAKDDEAKEKDRTYAISLEVAQRRVLDGTDRLRCPTARAVQPTAAATDRSAAGGSATDGQGPAMVPDDSAALLGLVADHQRLVQRYERVVERFDACRALNAGP